MRCSLCNNNTQAFFQQKERFFYKCNHCQSILLNNELHLNNKEEKARYDKHSDVINKGYQNFVSPIVKAVNKQHPNTDYGLDYGCGKSAIVQKMLINNGFNIAGYDPFYFPNTDSLNKRYHFITCCEVIEHFYNPKLEFNKLKQLLLPKGSLFFMTNLITPNTDFSTWWYKNDPTHVFFYSKQSFEYIYQTYHFSSLKINENVIQLSL